MTGFYYLSILAMVIELSEVKQIEWFEIEKCLPYKTDVENVNATSIQSNDGEAVYEGDAIISCVKAEEKAKKCDVFFDAGGLGSTFVKVSSRSKRKRCGQLNFQVEVATTVPNVGLNEVEYLMRNSLEIGGSTVPPNIESSPNSNGDRNFMDSSTGQSVFKKFSLVSMVVASKVTSLGYGVVSLVITQGVLLCVVFVWYAQYLMIRHYYNQPEIHHWCQENAKRESVLLTVKEEFPDYENV